MFVKVNDNSGPCYLNMGDVVSFRVVELLRIEFQLRKHFSYSVTNVYFKQFKTEVEVSQFLENVTGKTPEFS